MLLHGRKSTHCAEAVLMGVQRLPSTIVLKACRHYDNIAKSLKINEFILSCPRFALSLHKKSCISAYRSSKLGDSALDLHCLCTRKAASRHILCGRPKMTVKDLSRTNNYIPKI